MHYAPSALVTLRERPDLSPTIRAWLGDRLCGLPDPAHCFILLALGVPVGTAGLAASGLASRPDLTPWLVNLFVPAAFRGLGHAARLVAAVETAARALGAPTLWLVTRSAESFYARLGWQPVGPAAFHGDPATLMCRALGGDQNTKACQNAKAYRAESAAT